MLNVALIFLGGGLGSVLRYGATVLAVRLAGTGFPWGTFAVNVVGGFCMGLLVGLLALRGGGGEGAVDLRLLLGTGVLGGFTTFSAYSLDVVQLWERGLTGPAIAYAAGSVVLAVLAVALGLKLAWFTA